MNRFLDDPHLSFFLEATATAYALSTIDGDLPGAVVISWTLWAIFEHQRSSAYVKVYVVPALHLITSFHSFIHWSALAFAILSLIWVLKGLYGVYRKNTSGFIALSDEERAPLVG